MKVALIFKSFFELGQWWFRGQQKQIETVRSYPSSYAKAANEVDCGMTKEEIQREMRTNRCVGYNYNDE